MPADEKHLSALDALLEEPGATVTYKFLARHLDISANLAKKLLFAHVSRSSGASVATHVVSGWVKSGDVRAHVVRLARGVDGEVEAARKAMSRTLAADSRAQKAARRTAAARLHLQFVRTAIAIGTVVIFGTTAMFLYPLAYRAEWLPMTEEAFGMYVGATVHGVAHVVGAGEAVGPVAAGTAVIVKMTRVMLLAPALVAIGWLYNRRVDGGSDSPVAIPWFAVGFVAVAGFNSLSVLSADAVALIVRIDAFLLTVAMTALGLNTVVSKFKGIGWQPIKLGFVLAVWLIVFGFLATSALVASGL